MKYLKKIRINYLSIDGNYLFKYLTKSFNLFNFDILFDSAEHIAMKKGTIKINMNRAIFRGRRKNVLLYAEVMNGV